MMSATKQGVLASIGAATMYGVNIVYARMAAQGGLGGPDLILHRMFLMALLVGLLLALLRRSPLMTAREMKTTSLLALATSSLGLFYFSAVMFAPVAVAAIVFYTFPLIIMLLTRFVDGVPPSRRQLIVFMLCFAGLAVAIGPNLDGLDWRGLLLALLASVSAAVQYVMAGRMGPSDTVKTIFWTHVIGLPLVFLAVLAVGGPAPLAVVSANAHADIMATILYLGGLTLLFVAMKTLQPAVSGLIFYIEPVVAVVAAAVLLGEIPTPTQYIGGAIVLATLVGSGLIDVMKGRTA